MKAGVTLSSNIPKIVLKAINPGYWGTECKHKIIPHTIMNTDTVLATGTVVKALMQETQRQDTPSKMP